MATTTKEKVQAVGIVLFVGGIACLPFPRAGPKSALSMFEVIAHMGLLTKFGLSLMLLVGVVFALSYLVHK